MYNGKLSDNTQVKIPTVSMSGANAKIVLNNYLSETAKIGFMDGYAYQDGTR